LPTALTWQVSRLHFLRKLVLAAPASGLPSLLTALLSQVSCADATERFSDRAKDKAASSIHLILCLHRERGTPGSTWDVEGADSQAMAQRSAPTVAIDPESRS